MGSADRHCYSSPLTFLQSLATRDALDSDGNGNVYVLRSNYGASQAWVVYPSLWGGVTLRNLRTNRCLDGSRPHVVTLSCTYSPSQRWIVEPSGDGTVTLRNVKTDCVLYVKSAHRVYTGHANGASFQKWSPTPA